MTSARPVHAVRNLLVALAVTAASLTMVGSAAPAAHAAPTYSPWSSDYYDLKARVSLANKRQARHFVQAGRNDRTGNGDRQVAFAWKIVGSGVQHKSGARDLDPGEVTTFRTRKIPCGKRVVLSIAGRKTMPNGQWSEWRAITVRGIKRGC